MFYPENELIAIVNCPRCKERHVEPKIIVPCFKTLCARCVEELIDDKRFDCFFCNTQHVVPEGGFALNSSVELLLKLQPKEVHVNYKLVNNLKEKLNELTILYTDFSEKAQGLESSLHEHCTQLKNQIDLSCDQKIVQINDIREEGLEYVDEYRKSCLKNINENRKNIDDKLKKFQDYIERGDKFAKGFEVDENMIENEIHQTNAEIKQLKKAIDDLEEVKYNDTKLTFEIDKSDIDFYFIGSFYETKIKSNNIFFLI